VRPCQKKKKLGLEVWPKQYSSCFASIKPRAQTPAQPKKKKRKTVNFAFIFKVNTSFSYFQGIILNDSAFK
jgi:hypothetical protein